MTLLEQSFDMTNSGLDVGMQAAMITQEKQIQAGSSWLCSLTTMHGKAFLGSMMSNGRDKAEREREREIEGFLCKWSSRMRILPRAMYEQRVAKKSKEKGVTNKEELFLGLSGRKFY